MDQGETGLSLGYVDGVIDKDGVKTHSRDYTSKIDKRG
jgi:hypothetical protein